MFRMKKVYLFLADGFEEIEALTVVDVLRRGKIEIEMVSVTKNKTVIGSHNISVQADCLFEDIAEENIAMAILPGGAGTAHLKKHEALKKLIVTLNEKNVYIAAICAAPSVLGELGLLKDRTAVCYPGFEEQLLGAKIGANNVEIDDNFITSKGPATSMEFALALVGILTSSEKASQVQSGLLFV